MSSYVVRNKYVVLPVIIFVMVLVFLILVCLYSNTKTIQMGDEMLIGLPNFYLFMLIVLPCISIGIVHLSEKNANLRFLPGRSSNLQEQDTRIVRLRRVLLWVGCLASLLVTIDDASDKQHTLPPYMFSFNSELDKAEVFQLYFVLQEWDKPTDKKSTMTDSTAVDKQEVYFKKLQSLGYKGAGVTGFTSFKSWLRDSSFLYKYESFINLIGTVFICLFFIQLLLLIIAKKSIYLGTRSLIIWLILLCTLWFPAKIMSFTYFNLNDTDIPGIFALGFLLFLYGIIAGLYVKTNSQNTEKYLTLIFSFAALILTLISIYKPQYLKEALIVVEDLGWIYGGILIVSLGFLIAFITIHRLEASQKEINGIKQL